jgi:hypothetical protein
MSQETKALLEPDSHREVASFHALPHSRRLPAFLCLDGGAQAHSRARHEVYCASDKFRGALFNTGWRRPKIWRNLKKVGL